MADTVQMTIKYCLSPLTFKQFAKYICKINAILQFVNVNFYNSQMLNKDLIESAIIQKQYSALDYLPKIQTYKLLSELNQQEFDNQTFDQMWDQCKMNSKGQIKLQNIIQTFIKAQLILAQRDKEIQVSIQRLKQKIIDLKQQNNTLQIPQIRQELSDLQQQKTANLINLQIVRKPFRNFLKNNPHHIKNSRRKEKIEQEEQQNFEIKNILISNTHTYSWIFQLTFILLLVQIPIVLYYPVFVNIFLFLFILISLSSQYFCRIILRIQLLTIIFTLILDIVWYCVQARTLWNLVQYHDWPIFISPYLKIAVILFSVSFVGKIILSLLFISQYNTDQSQNKKISFFGIWKIQLSHEDFSKNMFSTLTSPHLVGKEPQTKK